jgi:hypothetical protein
VINKSAMGFNLENEKANPALIQTATPPLAMLPLNLPVGPLIVIQKC